MFFIARDVMINNKCPRHTKKKTVQNRFFFFFCSFQRTEETFPCHTISFALPKSCQ